MRGNPETNDLDNAAVTRMLNNQVWFALHEGKFVAVVAGEVAGIDEDYKTLIAGLGERYRDQEITFFQVNKLIRNRENS